jgi:hypothetical protein
MDNLGNKQSIWNWQRMVVSLLTNILAALGGGIGTTRTPNLQRVSGPGVIAAGSTSISIRNAGNTDGQVLGTTLKPGESVTWAVNQVDSIGAITFDGTGTELVIAKIS